MNFNELKLAMISQKEELETTEERFYSIIDTIIESVPSLQGVDTENDWFVIEKHPATKFFAEEIVKLGNQKMAVSDALDVFKKYSV